MNLKITKEIKLTADEIKDILIKYLHLNYNFSGVFDIDFKIGKKSYPSQLTGATIRISENE